MQISRKSWHWRVYQWFKGFSNVDGRQSVNLCPYVRAVILWAPLYRIWLGCVWILSGLAALAHWIATTKYVRGIALAVVIGAAAYAAGKLTMDELGVFVCVLFIGCALAFLIYWEEGPAKRRRAKPRKELEPSKFRSLVGAYWQAIHDRICPQIDVVD